MQNVVKSKCYRIIADVFKGDPVLIDVVKDIGGEQNNINYYLQNDDTTIIELFDWTCTKDETFTSLVEIVVNPPVSDNRKQSELVANLRNVLLDANYDLIEAGRRNDKVRYRLIEAGTDALSGDTVDLTTFDSQYPLGLPVSRTKPNIQVGSVKGRQTSGFVENGDVGLLKGELYPRFDFLGFANWCNPEKRLNNYTSPGVKFPDIAFSSWIIGYNLCQTPSEKQFYHDYLVTFARPFLVVTSDNRYSFASLVDKVPALVPQVWVRFDSQSRDEKTRMGYKDDQLPYRVDFVAFWNHRRYIIMIDGVEHYAVQGRGGWDANEEKYAARLREDRLLRTEGWQVFRLGNWEVRDETRRRLALQELREFIGFELPEKPKQVPVPVSPQQKRSTPTSPIPRNKPLPTPLGRAINPPKRPIPTKSLPAQGNKSTTFFAGQKVRHKTFGDGIVVSCKRVENDEEVTVAFTGKSVKRLLASFAMLEPIRPQAIEDDEDLPF